VTDEFAKGRGIGKEMALELARRGAKVAVNYANSAETAEQVVQEIKKMGSDAIAIKANVANVSETIALMDKVVEHFGKLDICCSNSGVVSFGHLKDVTEEEYDRVMQINTRGQFFVAREAYKHMEVGGRIILMGSITGQAKGVPKHTLYSGSKGAIETFARCMAIGELMHPHLLLALGVPSFPLISEIPHAQNREDFSCKSLTRLTRLRRQEDHCQRRCPRRYQD